MSTPWFPALSLVSANSTARKPRGATIVFALAHECIGDLDDSPIVLITDLATHHELNILSKMARDRAGALDVFHCEINRMKAGRVPWGAPSEQFGALDLDDNEHIPALSHPGHETHVSGGLAK
jgi:hypothetical protein